MDYLQRKITTVKGIGTKRAELFNKHGIFSIDDLLSYYPRKYEDLSVCKKALECDNASTACIKAVLISPVTENYVRRGMIYYKAKFTDDDTVIDVTIFNNRYLANSLKLYGEYLLYGKIEHNLTSASMTAPKIIKADSAAKIRPVYSTSGKLTVGIIAAAVKNVLADMPVLDETLSRDIILKYNLIPLDKAVRYIHFPPSQSELINAKKRLAFEELLVLQLGLIRIKGKEKKHCENIIKTDYCNEFFSTLPFKPTAAQIRAASECAKDMASGTSMARLLQGDVGSGKTAVAAALIYSVVKNGYQCALMAPTEILANQHYNTFVNFFEKTNITVALLTGSTPSGAKAVIKDKLSQGKIDLVIGTHALITKDVMFKSPGLVITDEQHRFGVNQRAALVQSGKSVHNLVMSATPIPRTLGMVIYSDLDISLLDELPLGRKPVKTSFVNSSYHERMYKFLRSQVAEGRQGYIVCPLVENSDEETVAIMGRELKSVNAYAEDLAKNELRGINIAILHGKMNAKEKSAVMTGFVNGSIKVLIATTVIEVGVDVPNATIMIIEDADRFGLSQLHQLRGRIGRGNEQSYCILVSDSKSDNSKERLTVMKNCTDGFKIADEDLRLRGPGDFFGQRQHGLPAMKIADMIRDLTTVEAARECARYIIDNNIKSDAMEQKIDKMFSAINTGI